MQDYDIVIANGSEKDKIRYFIDNFWKKGHSLVKSSELFDFQHFNPITQGYNFVLAKSDIIEWPGIVALMGFIPTYQYDKELSNNGDYWGAIWKKREDIKDERFKSTGFDVYQHIYDEPHFHSYAAIGVSKIALKIYKFWGCKVGQLNQYYILNDKASNFNIAGGSTNNHLGAAINYQQESGWTVSEIDPIDINSISLRGYYRPLKSVEYIINRYVKHPIYHYRYLGVYKYGELVTLLVCRFMEVNNAISIRIVDVLGQLQGTLYDELLSYMNATGAEYIDLMNYGISENVFYTMGFNKLDADGDLIIPNYFEPFEQKNVKIDIAWKADYDNYVAFKGDSDQDRPNVL